MDNEKFQALILEHLAKLDQEMADIKNNMATKDELNRAIADIKNNMVTKDDLNRGIAESQKDIIAMLQHIEKKLDLQNEQMEDKFDALNDRLFSQETQLQRLKKQAR
ncbi:hypothetical protein EDC14_100955 [Hydrogenispora ethanolica]|uniref:Uncharacterized protein n=1 Tax=Hydrogenispora ethanolica TaxID=1082276 RepID=A0A4R1RVQ5_HYDET|nr:hypothetical protein [Hydrogenispora ethanolica]TCL70738.1 hypothetical protein EDC14_100955 [Hydrogenispora ethanolica]